MTSSISFAACLAAAALAASACWAQPKDERLIAAVPQGYTVESDQRDGNVINRQMVPKGQTLADWSEMFSTHVFVGMTGMTPDQFKDAMRERWFASCENAHASAVAGGEENGYPFAVWVLRCPLNSNTGKREIAWFKAIQGNDNFYLVQKAFTAEPNEQQVKRWMMILRRVEVCDTRRPDRPCPAPGK